MPTKKVITISTLGEVAVAEMPSENEYNFLNTSVGGWIEMVRLERELEGVILWVNEEGKIDGLPYNDLATLVWEMSYGQTDIIVGNAVLTGDTDDEGETLSLTDEQVAKVIALFA
jgi:hypothetical protein